MVKGKLLLSVIFTVHICTIRAESIPFITKCISTDWECHKQTAQAAVPVFAAGIPEFKMQPLDPLLINKVEGNSPNLKFTSSDVTVTGIKDCIIEDVQRQAGKLQINVSVICDKITVESRYEVHGRILIVPFEGDGNLFVNLSKLWIHVDSDLLERLDKQGRKHWHINNYTYKYDLRGNSDIALTNLFEGNEVLGRAARELITNSSNEVVLEVGPPVIKVIVERIIKSINQFYHAVPADDLSLD